MEHGQGIEGIILWRTPYRSALLYLPVAERHYHVLQLQSLTLMYGYELYAVDRVGRNGLFVERAVPFVYERIDVSRIVDDEVCQQVEELEEVSVFALYGLEVEDVVEVLCQVV